MPQNIDETLHLAYYQDNLFAASPDKSMLKTYLKYMRRLSKEERKIRMIKMNSDSERWMYEPYLLSEWHGWILTTEDIRIIQEELASELGDFDRSCSMLLEYGRNLTLVGEKDRGQSLIHEVWELQQNPPEREHSLRALILMHPLFTCDMESYLEYHREFVSRQNRIGRYF